MTSETIADWCGFLGAWLLVAGPLYQGALDLDEQRVDRAGFQEAVDKVQLPVMPTAWWWLAPPIMLILRRRRHEAYRREVRALLTEEQQAQFTGLAHKATGWFAVAAGASLIAVKESWELAEQLEWPLWGLLLAIAAMLALSVAITVFGLLRHRTSQGPTRSPELPS